MADVFDALGGSPDRERALVIMKYSRLAVFDTTQQVCELAFYLGLAVSL